MAAAPRVLHQHLLHHVRAQKKSRLRFAGHKLTSILTPHHQLALRRLETAAGADSAAHSLSRDGLG